VVKDEDMIEM